MVSSSLIGVLAQRLMRRVCSVCRVSYQPSSKELARYGLQASQEVAISLYKANSLQVEEIQEAKARDQLCTQCQGVGYKGRCGVYEVMRLANGCKA
jgi:type IV pilus assembly protein PilB